MRSKLDSHQYKSLEEFESDLKLVWNNAMTYNQKDTIYYRAAVRIRDVGKINYRHYLRINELK